MENKDRKMDKEVIYQRKGRWYFSMLHKKWKDHQDDSQLLNIQYHYSPAGKLVASVDRQPDGAGKSIVPQVPHVLKYSQSDLSWLVV